MLLKGVEILVPSARQSSREFWRVLDKLERNYGVDVTVLGISPHDRCRSQLLSSIRKDTEIVVFVDDDQTFHAGNVLSLVRSLRDAPTADLMTGVYCCRHEAERGRLALNFNPLAGGELKLGDGGSVVDVAACGFGFVALRTANLGDIDAPAAFYGEGVEGKAYFLPVVENFIHLGEDRSFCVRARQAGWRLCADTSIVVGHTGAKTYYPWSVG